jgi:hypothetical protein
MDYEKEEELQLKSVNRFHNGEGRLLDKDLNSSENHLYYYTLDGKGYAGAVNRDFATGEYYTGVKYGIHSKKLVKLKTPIKINKAVKELPKEKREGRTIDSVFVGDTSFDNLLDLTPDDVKREPLKTLAGIGAKILPFAVRSNKLQGSIDASQLPNWSATGSATQMRAQAPNLQQPNVLPARQESSTTINDLRALRNTIFEIFKHCVRMFSRTKNDLYRQYALTIKEFLDELTSQGTPAQQLQDAYQFWNSIEEAVNELDREMSDFVPPKEQNRIRTRQSEEPIIQLQEERKTPVVKRTAPRKKDEGQSSSENAPIIPSRPPPRGKQPVAPFEAPQEEEPVLEIDAPDDVPDPRTGPKNRIRYNKDRRARISARAVELYKSRSQTVKRERFVEIAMLLNDGDFTEGQIKSFVEYPLIKNVNASITPMYERLSDERLVAEIIYSHNRIVSPYKPVHILLGIVFNISPLLIKNRWINSNEGSNARKVMGNLGWVNGKKKD